MSQPQDRPGADPAPPPADPPAPRADGAPLADGAPAPSADAAAAPSAGAVPAPSADAAPAPSAAAQAPSAGAVPVPPVDASTSASGPFPPAGASAAPAGAADPAEAPTQVLGSPQVDAGATRVGEPGGAAGFPPPPGGPGVPSGGAGFPPPGGPGVPPSGGAGFSPPGGFPPPGGALPPFGDRRLRRSSRRKVVAGVAGGLGEYSGIDPVLFRVLFAVLTLFGGTGILLYIVGWLFLPAEDKQVSPAESLIGRGGDTKVSDAVKAVGLVIAGLVLAGVLALGDGGDVALLIVVTGGAVLLVRHLSDRREGGPPQPDAPPAPPATPQPYEQPQSTAPGFAQTGFPQTGLPQTGFPQTGFAEGRTAVAVADPPVAPPPGKRRKERSILSVLTLSLLLLVLGVAAAVDSADAGDPSAKDYLALAVGTLGLGLVVGAWFGRARGLVWLGIPLIVAMITVGTVEMSFEGGVGDRRYAPQRIEQVQAEYRVGVGSLRVDLSALDFSERLTQVRATAGMGDVEIVVPADADVSVKGTAGAGEVELFGETDSGTSATRSTIDRSPTGDDRIDLILDLDVSYGKVEVTRATA